MHVRVYTFYMLGSPSPLVSQLNILVKNKVSFVWGCQFFCKIRDGARISREVRVFGYTRDHLTFCHTLKSRFRNPQTLQKLCVIYHVNTYPVRRSYGIYLCMIFIDVIDKTR